MTILCLNDNVKNPIINIPIKGHLPAIATVVSHDFWKVVVDCVELLAVFLTSRNSI